MLDQREKGFSDDKLVMLNEGETDCSSGESESCEGGMSTKEMFDYEYEGFYHEAGHAIVRACLQMPFISVTVEEVPGVHAGYTDVVPRITSTFRDFINIAMFTAAGRVATDIFAALNPGQTRFEDSDRDDRSFLSLQAHQMRYWTGVDPDQWEKDMVERTEAILRIPYVWAAVENLAWELLQTEGTYAIPAKQVRKILRQAKKDGSNETKAG
jgi:hypothetical protein